LKLHGIYEAADFLFFYFLLDASRFGEGLRLAKEKMDEKNVYAINPAFDRQ